MDMFVVHGGRRLRGCVRVSGAKNAALPILAAVLASDGPTILHEVPDLVDVTTLCQLLTALGVEVSRDGRALDAAESSESAPARTADESAAETNDACAGNGELPADDQEQYVHFPFGVGDTDEVA